MTGVAPYISLKLRGLYSVLCQFLDVCLAESTPLNLPEPFDQERCLGCKSLNACCLQPFASNKRLKDAFVFSGANVPPYTCLSRRRCPVEWPLSYNSCSWYQFLGVPGFGFGDLSQSEFLRFATVSYPIHGLRLGLFGYRLGKWCMQSLPKLKVACPSLSDHPS